MFLQEFATSTPNVATASPWPPNCSGLAAKTRRSLNSTRLDFDNNASGLVHRPFPTQLDAILCLLVELFCTNHDNDTETNESAILIKNDVANMHQRSSKKYEWSKHCFPSFGLNRIHKGLCEVNAIHSPNFERVQRKFFQECPWLIELAWERTLLQHGAPKVRVDASLQGIGLCSCFQFYQHKVAESPISYKGNKLGRLGQIPLRIT
ncbi:hypothetical protein CPB85DRAFT_1258315 [Mucidula mucida]|nr:hypothetical protein CPB85DRAFT_1258315 [Mucidula mucida]